MESGAKSDKELYLGLEMIKTGLIKARTNVVNVSKQKITNALVEAWSENSTETKIIPVVFQDEDNRQVSSEKVRQAYPAKSLLYPNFKKRSVACTKLKLGKLTTVDLPTTVWAVFYTNAVAFNIKNNDKSLMGRIDATMVNVDGKLNDQNLEKKLLDSASVREHVEIRFIFVK